MIRRPPKSKPLYSSAASDVYKRQIEAARKKLRITEVPITYYPRLTPSKLHSWGDGWRHLRFMMLYNPTPFFSIPGFLVLILGIFMIMTLSIRGNVETTRLTAKILDYHSLELGLLFGIVLFFAGLVRGSGVVLKWIGSGYGSLS